MFRLKTLRLALLTFALAIAANLALASATFAKEKRYRDSDKKSGKFINSHDARDGRWDGRGPKSKNKWKDDDDDDDRRGRRRNRDWDDDDRRGRRHNRDWDDDDRRGRRHNRDWDDDDRRGKRRDNDWRDISWRNRRWPRR
ncbi:MAG: hypothetical protein AB7U82_27175 [Blastocatellales bacterium]